MADEKTKQPTEKEPKIAPVPPDGGQKVPAGAPKDVPIKADAPPDDDDQGDPSDPPETRQERKNARAAFRQAEQAKENERKAREEALLYRAKLEAQQVHIEGLRAVMPQQPSQLDQQIEQIGKQQDAILSRWQLRQSQLKQGEQIPDEEVARTRNEYQRLADQRTRLVAQSVTPQATGPTAQQVQALIQQAQLQAKHPEIFAREEALAYAVALAPKYQREGRTPFDAIDQAMQDTKKQLGLGKASNGHSVDVDAARFAGVPMGAAPMSKGGGVYRMSAAEQRMAHAQYPKDAPDVAEKKWAEKTGKKILAKAK